MADNRTLPLLDLPLGAHFGSNAVQGRHRLHTLPLFDDDSLASLLDSSPRQNLFALSMGHDIRKPEENQLASHENVSGSELLAAVRGGRLWLNITRI